jgi:integrase/recombinase XerD
MTPIAPHISAFLRERLPLQRGASAHTCTSYAYSFQLLFMFASHRFGVTPSELSLEQIDAPLVMDFLASLEAERGNSPTTRNARLAAIKSFMHFVEYRVPALLEQIRRVLAIPTKRTDQPLIQHLSLAEMQAMLNAPDLQTRAGIRDRAMLHVCFAAGLRVSELLTLPLTALTWQPTLTIHIQGKGRRHRALPLWQHTAEDVRAWLAVRGDVAVPELFLSHQGRAMTRVGFTYLLRKYVQRAAQDCPSLRDKHVSPPCLAPYVRHDDLSSDWRSPQGLPVVRPCGYASHGGVCPGRSN